MGILLLNAGHEATVHALGNGVRAILEHVPVRRSPRTPPAMSRRCSVTNMFTRYALEDVEVAGERFRRGDVIGLLLGSANRDPAKFTEPDRFVAGRSPNPHVSFGAGIHACVGAPLINDARHFRGLEALRLAW